MKIRYITCSISQISGNPVVFFENKKQVGELFCHLGKDTVNSANPEVKMLGNLGSKSRFFDDISIACSFVGIHFDVE